MTSERDDFGGRLRAAREARGISLAQIATTTKIGRLALESLERNDVSRLPGGLFSRAFVRAYAREVGLDPERTVKEFAERFGDDVDGATGERATRSTRGDTSRAGGASGLRWVGLLVTVMLIAAFLGISRYLGRQDGEPVAPAAPAPASPAPTTPSSTTPPVAEPAAGASASVPASVGTEGVDVASAGAPDAQQRSAESPQATQQRRDASSGAIAALLPPEATGPASVGTPTLRVVLAPTARCWVSARVDGKQVVGRDLQAGETVELSAADSIVLVAGDAGALAYTVNSVPGRPLGRAGQAITVSITTANYKAFTNR